MDNHSLIPRIIKKTLEPFRYLENSFRNFWNGTPNISYIGERAFLPEIDVFENDTEFHITANIHGLEEDDIHIGLNKGKLTLRGGKMIEKDEDGSNCHIREHSSIYFNHMVKLPSNIADNNFEATMKGGVIDITVPKLTNLRKTDPRKQLN